MSEPVRTLGLFGNPDKPEIDDAIANLRELCAEQGVGLLATEDLANGGPAAGLPVAATEQLGRRCDVVIVYGGDGTMLRAARLLGDTGVPLLGINLGSLGYLTDVPVTEQADAVRQLVAGEFQVVERSRVSAVVRRDGREVTRTEALNDIVVNMGSLPRALTMQVRVNQATLGQFIGDGLIVSTPTGSTAYNLSAGGPIVHPAVQGLLVTPICPHSLAIRPLLVPEEKRIELRLLEVGQGATLTADGQIAFSLERDDRIVYRKARRPVLLVKFPRSDFLRAMRHKLQWGAIKRRRRRT